MTHDQAKAAFEKLFSDQMEEQEAKDFLIELYEKGESAEEIAAAVEVMRAHAVQLPISQSLQEKVVDIVGTGGDKSGSFNISTTSAFVLAACGCFVAKHGNRSITSKSGSADVLAALGVNLDLKPAQQLELLERTGFVFLFAIHHHPAMKHIMPIRKSLPHRTIFNILGPLTNPANARKKLIGVFSGDFIGKMAEAMRIIEANNILVVSSRDGLDEISISDLTDFAHLQNGNITEGVIDPQELGFDLAPKSEILGGEAEANAEITRGILGGTIQGAKRDIVLLNSGAALWVDGRCDSLQAGIVMAREAIEQGAAAQKLQEVITISTSL